MRSFILILLSSICLSLQAQKSYIQVISESGLSVFLDGTFKGETTSDLGGLIIENVSTGVHIIKVVKEGFNPQEDRISIKAGEVFSYKVRPFVPQVVISQQGNIENKEIDLQVGVILIQSLPVTIKISIPKIGLKDTKVKDEWIASKIPIGRYDATFSWNNKTLNYSFGIKRDKKTQLFVNMISGIIEDRTPEEPVTPEGPVTPEEHVTPEEPTWVHVNYGYSGDFHTIQVGNQTWFAENLYPTLTTELEGLQERRGQIETQDQCYRWVLANKSCPSGWHLPSLPEWKILIDYLGGIEKAGSKMMRLKGESPIKTNRVFNAFPSGFWDPSVGGYISKDEAAFFWTSTESTDWAAFAMKISVSSNKVEILNSNKGLGFNVRCIRN